MSEQEEAKPGCPKCGAIVTELKAYAKEESFYRVYLDSAKFNPDLDSIGVKYEWDMWAYNAILKADGIA